MILRTHRLRFKILVSLLATLTFTGCQDGVSSNPDEATPAASETYRIQGVVQKGPYIQGTEITVRELDDDLVPTGRVFVSTIDDDTGAFSIPVEVASPYIELSADGYYFDEVSGELSDSQLPLQAIADLSQSASINLNLLTHMQKGRIEYLMDQGASYADATLSAREEVLGVFSIASPPDFRATALDITKTGENNGILLAVSALLQGSRSVAELSELLSFIRTDIRQDGTLDSPTTIGQIERAVGDVITSADEIRQNIVDRYGSFGMAVDPPEFASYVKGMNPELRPGLGGSIGAIPDNPSIENVLSVDGDDADYRDNVRSLRDQGDTVLDEITGLTWMKNPVSVASNEEAVTYCENLSINGLEWRVPDLAEISSLYDFQTGEIPPPFPAGNTSMISRTPYEAKASDSVTEYFLGIGGNGTIFNSIAGGGALLCVAGNHSSMQRKYFQESGETAVDLGTGYIWQKSMREDLTWNEAIAYCEDLVLDGHNDWRLPDLSELLSLMDPSQGRGGIDASIFSMLGTYESAFWTSSPNSSAGTHAWTVTFGGDDPFAMGNPGRGYSTETKLCVRCMRSE